jgi:hypothetical protein
MATQPQTQTQKQAQPQAHTNPPRPPTEERAATERGQSHNQVERETPGTTESRPSAMEGEGSRTGARRYDAHAHRFARDGEKVEELGEEAGAALDGPEGDDLRAAEDEGRSSQHGETD